MIVFYSVLLLIYLAFIIPDFSNNIRYKLETAFGEPDSFFSGTSLGIKVEDFQGYLEEYIFDDFQNKLTIEPYYFPEDKFFIYGSVVNSSEKLKVIVNNQVIHNKKMSYSSSENFWGEYYLDRYFVVEVTNLKESYENEIILISGNAVEKLTIYLE